MLPNILSWAPNSNTVAYSRLNGNERRVYFYDIHDEVSYPSQFQNSSKWFELSYIHEEQLLIHDWENGFLVYDTEEKRTQLMIKESSSITFAFDSKNKELTVTNKTESYLYNPIKKTKKVLGKNLRELLISLKYKIFITVNSNSELEIYYKNASVFQAKNAYGIYLTDNESHLYFFTDDQFKVLDLKTLKVVHSHEINGLVQNANTSKSLFQFTTLVDDSYSIFIYEKKSNKLNLLKEIKHPNQLFTSISPKSDNVAIISDLDIDSKISVISTKI